MRKVITSATGIVLVAIALAKLLGYVYRIVLSRLGPDQYGVFSIALAIFGIVFTISVLGLDQGILRHLHVVACSCIYRLRLPGSTALVFRANACRAI